jgi:prepilin-type N-terminal cleavage/methylation domain-containing protein
MRICAVSRKPKRSGKAGYTLLELLVVLAVIGLMAGLAAPPFLQMIEQQRRIADTADVERALAALPMTARTIGRDLVVRPAGASETAVPPSPVLSPLARPQIHAIVGLPLGWKAAPTSDIWVRSDGVCFGGSVEVTAPNGARSTYQLDPPFCTPRPTSKANR